MQICTELTLDLMYSKIRIHYMDVLTSFMTIEK